MEERKSNIVMYVGIAIIILLLAGLIFTVSSNSKNKNSLNAEKLASEKLLSEKLSLEKELAKMKADYASLSEKSSATEKLLEETNLKIAENQKRINALSGENRSLRNVKKEMEELQKVKAELENSLVQQKADYQKLLAKSNDLQNSIASLETDKKELTLQLDKAKTYKSDNYLTTATRGKKTEKMVIRGSRTKKLNLTFNVPQSLTDALSFKIVTPSGSIITPEDKAMSWNFIQGPLHYTASLSAVSGEFEESRQVVLTYNAVQKLAAGEYKIQILCNGENIGNCRIKLK